MKEFSRVFFEGFPSPRPKPALTKGRVLLKLLRSSRTTLLATGVVDEVVVDEWKDSPQSAVNYVESMLETLGKYPGKLEDVWREKEARVDLWCQFCSVNADIGGVLEGMRGVTAEYQQVS